MTAVAGWYPDPAGTPELRYWDGQNWTEQLTPVPAAPAYAAAPQYAAEPVPSYVPQNVQPSYSYVQSPGSQTFPGLPTQPPRRSRGRLYGVIAGVVAVAVVATAVPLALADGGSSVRTTAAFRNVLLTASDVDALAGGDFTLDTSNDNDKDNDSASGCPAADKLDGRLSPPDKAHADRTFNDRSQALTVTEILSYAPGNAKELTELKQVLSSCRTITLGGESLSLTVKDGPVVSGSDDTLDMQMQGNISGHSFVMDMEFAGFGDSIVGVVYGGLGDAASVNDTADSLLVRAASKARSAL